ncbi:MAG: branched-chain amino acid ABC transporter permease, partial [Pseudonocardia sp.]|nr:branched-chain amino acid ABC transporter permease [Pseudonocardia sp.]
MTATGATTTAAGAAPSATGRRGRTLRAAVPVVVVLVLAAAPFFLAPFALSTLTAILVFGLLAASLDLLVGITGLPSLGHAAYFGVGAYTAGWLTLHVTPAFPVGLLAGVAAGALVALATGWVAVRSTGIFFLMLTLAIGVLIQQVAFAWTSVTGGSNGLFGIPAPSVGGVTLAGVGFVHWYVLVGGLIGYLVLRAVVA